jgi:hypothetical protein
VEILFGIATILGGLAALWYFWEKLKRFFRGRPAEHERDFRKHLRERAFTEIEELKDEIGRLYELSANWKGYDAKADEYAKALAPDDYLIGKYNKYPDIARTARDTVHWCKIVAFDEKSRQEDLIQNKKELSEKYKNFIRACEAYIDGLA